MNCRTYKSDERLTNQQLAAFFCNSSLPFFQHTDFIRFFSEFPNQLTKTTICFDSQKVIGVCVFTVSNKRAPVRYLVTKTQIIYGPVIAADCDQKVVTQEILKEIDFQIPWYNLFVQFRNRVDTSLYETVFKKQGYRFSERLNLITDISNSELMWFNLSSSRRRQIRKSRQNCLTINCNPEITQIKEFYNILRNLYNRRVHKPLPDLQFFVKFNELTIKSEIHGRIFLCMYNGSVVGGIVAPIAERDTIYEWYICGLDEEMSRHGIYPSVMATWAAMEYGNEAGCRHFDFMGMGKPNEPYGVRDFKARFGGKWVNYGRWNKITNIWLYALAETAYNLLYLYKRIRNVFNGKSNLIKKDDSS